MVQENATPQTEAPVQVADAVEQATAQIEQTAAKPEKDENAQRKSRMDRRVAELEKTNSSLTEERAKLEGLVQSLQTAQRVRDDLPEDAEEAVKKIAERTAQLAEREAQINQIAKETLADKYADLLGVDKDIFMALPNAQSMELVYQQGLIAREAIEKANPTTTSAPETPVEPEPAKHSGFDNGAIGAHAGKAVSDMTSEEFEAHHKKVVAGLNRTRR